MELLGETVLCRPNGYESELTRREGRSLGHLMRD